MDDFSSADEVNVITFQCSTDSSIRSNAKGLMPLKIRRSSSNITIFMPNFWKKYSNYFKEISHPLHELRLVSPSSLEFPKCVYYKIVIIIKILLISPHDQS